MARRTPPQAPATDRHFVTALARGLAVLACFRSSDRMLGNAEIAQRCKLPKSTVSRLTYTLTQLGYLATDETRGPQRQYRLGSSTLGLASAMLARMDLRQAARPLMQELADFAGAMVSLAVRDRLSMIYVEVCRSPATYDLTIAVGSRVPLATSAIGRALLAAVPESERAEILARAHDLDDLAAQQIEEGIARGLADVARYGCATSFGDWVPDTNGIAIAFQPDAGRPFMALNCGAPNVSRELLLNEVRPRMIELVRQLKALPGPAGTA